MTITNKLNLPKVFENAVKSFQRDYTNTSKYSATDLLKSPYMLNLEKLHSAEITEDVMDRVWALTGTALHEVLTKSNDSKEVLIEERLKVVIDGIEISGQFDAFYEDGTLDDYKMSSVWKYKYKDYTDFEQQLNIYAYLLYIYGFTVKKIRAIMILRDYSKGKSKTEKDYPQNPIEMIELNLWDNEKTEAFIKDRIQKHLTETDIICNKKERWLRDEKWAIMKKGNKKATKLFDDELSASEYLKTLDDKYSVEYREGVDAKCEDYCRVNKWCEYYNPRAKERK